MNIEKEIDQSGAYWCLDGCGKIPSIDCSRNHAYGLYHMVGVHMHEVEYREQPKGRYRYTKCETGYTVECPKCKSVFTYRRIVNGGGVQVCSECGHGVKPSEWRVLKSREPAPENDTPAEGMEQYVGYECWFWRDGGDYICGRLGNCIDNATVTPYYNIKRDTWYPSCKPTDGTIRLKAAESERDELQASFEIRQAADKRATQLWHDAGGDELTWPDHTDLCVWLMVQNDELRAAVSRLNTSRTKSITGLESMVEQREATTKDVRELIEQWEPDTHKDMACKSVFLRHIGIPLSEQDRSGQSQTPEVSDD